jgi:hypothetical protein
MVAFVCNLCGARNQVEQFASEPATCPCGSNVRMRALVHLLSVELFGHSIPACDFPRLKGVRGIGLSDQECYARILADKFDYTNTRFDREPRLDLREPHAALAGGYDFLLAADVIEHIAPPIVPALAGAHALLKPNGFFGVTVYCNPSDRLREHFADLHEFRVVPLGGREVLINRRRDGSLEVREDLIFHGGAGETLEMREFGLSALEADLLAAGFREVHFLTANVPDWGILFDHDTSQPLIARRQPYALDRCAQSQLFEVWRDAEDRAWNAGERLQTAYDPRPASRWTRLGRRLGMEE